MTKPARISVMNGKAFKEWRERMALTQQQIADRFRVTRTTIQNWESELTPMPQAVDMACETWEGRLKQENPNLGPLTLIYSNRSMFINPYGPRREPAMMQQEAYQTNAAALARVQQLWGRQDFCNPFIIDESRASLWNIVELERVVSGKDTGAPTLPNLLKTIARHVRDNSDKFVRSGPKMLTPAETKKRQQAIESQADELDQLANSGLREILRDRGHVEAVFSELIRLGTKAPDSLVSNVAQAFAIFERGPAPAESEARLEQGGYVLDYRGCVIIWPKVRRDSSRWTVNLVSENPALLAKLGGCVVIDDFYSLDNAIAKARRYVDELI
jgi:DNA-binding XRE family transcriptional regulator